MTPPDDDGRSMKERMLAGDLYIFNDAELLAANRRAHLMAHDYQRAYDSGPDDAYALLQQLLGAVAPDVHIKPPLFVDYGFNISIGAGTFINYGLVALDVAAITIGRDVQIGPNVQLLTPTHPVDPALRRAKFEAAEPIVIGDNVWLGGGALILPGVTIGENCVVGAGAVVTRDVPANVVVAGNPARILRHIDAPE